MAKNPSVSALLKPKASVGRNVFPLDQKHVFSMKAGHITPVKAIHFMPNDYFKIQAHDFSMTFPMNTAAFLRGRKETAFYSVYYNAVWSLYNQYMATRRDPKTSGLDIKSQIPEPRVPLFQLYTNCLVQYYFYVLYEHVSRWVAQKDVGFYPYEVGYRLAQQELAAQRVNSTTVFNGITIRANNQTFTADLSDLVYYNSQSDLIKGQYGWNWSLLYNSDNKCDFKDVALDMSGLPRVFSWIRKLDMLGYGNVYPFFEICERRIQKVLAEDGGECDTLEELLHIFRPAFSDLFYKLLACSTLNDTSEPSERIIINQHKYVNLYALCSYNLIFYHFFRNSYYDLDYEPNDYNLDFAYQRNNTTRNGILSLSAFSIRFLDIESHQWKKDLFTAVLPDTQFGAVSSLSINIDPQNTLAGAVPYGVTGNASGRWSVPGSGTQGDNSLNVENGNLKASVLDGTPGLYDVFHTHDYSGSIDWSAASGNVANALDVIAIKRAELLQDYRQTLMRAGNKTSDIFKAIYGGAPSSEHEDDIIPRFLETFGEDLFVDPVEATATTGQDNNGTLGDLSARGKFRGDSKAFTFNAGNNFGLILCLTYVVPEAEYNSYMLDKHNMELSPEAHYLPTYENWGLEPVYSDELNGLLPMKDTQALGFAPRYYHKKQAVDQVHGAFVSMNTNLVERDDNLLIADYDFFGEFNHWVCPRTDMQNRQITLLRDFYISPRVLDNVFVRAAGADLADDQFICNMYFEIKSTRGLSKVGLLNFV